MKHLLVCLAATLLLKSASGQKTAYPAKEQVLKDAKNAYALNSISQIYTLPLTWDKIKLEYKTFVNGGETAESVFSDYQSTLAKKASLNYDDMTETQVIATTPKDKEDKYYEILIRVRYTRYGGVTPAAAWSFKECYIGQNDYYQKGGSAKANHKRVSDVLSVFKNYTGESTPKEPVHFYMPFDEYDFARIDSIYVDNSKQDKNLTYQRYQNFIIAGTLQKADGNIFTYYPQSSAGLSIEWYLKEGEKEWKIRTVSIEQLKPSQKQLSAKEMGLSGNASLATLKKAGFESVYKKTSAFERNVNTKSDLEDFKAELEKIFKLIYDNPEQGKKALEDRIDASAPNRQEIFDSWYNPIVTAKKLLCGLSKDPVVNLSAWMEDGEGNKKLHIQSMYANLKFKREETTDKDLLKSYKEAGVSKETLKTTAGRYDEAWAPKIEPAIKNNRWVITNVASAPKKPD